MQKSNKNAVRDNLRKKYAIKYGVFQEHQEYVFLSPPPSPPLSTFHYQILKPGATAAMWVYVVGATLLIAGVTAQDECVVNSVTCQAGGQTCVDPDLAKAGDWICRCVLPLVGEGTAAVAVCTYDECWENEATCSAVGQVCADANDAETSLNDWKCHCPPPLTDSALLGPATCAFEGECATQHAVCTAAGQTCHDADTTTPDTWQCFCVSPTAGTLGNQAPATCTLDECIAVCPTCATPTVKSLHTCTAAQQDCLDPNKSPESLADWECSCRAPAVGMKVNGAATCGVDECADADIKRVCEDAGQFCVDDNTATGSVDDWVCRCTAPSVGAANGRVAVCMLEECQDEAVFKICSDAGQECEDLDTTTTGNWECKCPAPATGSAVAGVATCNYDGECGDAAIAKVCTDAKQTCVDTDKATPDTWMCSCVAPYSGANSVMAPATCTIDECVATCPTCAQNTCPVGQTCKDSDTSSTSLNDWSCTCDVGTGTAAGAAAVCVLDECIVQGTTCTASSQLCVDPNTAVSSQGDWVCRCQAPASGEAVAGAAACTVNECDANGKTCTDAGQVCSDQNTASASLNDWTCNCPAPATGMMFTGVATCTYTSGCADAAKLAVCTGAGQLCLPGDASVPGDFACSCPAPMTGANGVNAVAVCTINECDEVCATCARTSLAVSNTCTSAAQTCTDPDVGVLSDWFCSCAAPSTTTAVGAAVVKCALDECVTPSQNAGAQTCEHFKRYTTQGCECACGWQLQISGDGPGVQDPCNTACCNPNQASGGAWCVVADTDFNRMSATCAALVLQQRTCTSPDARPPAGSVAPLYTDQCAAAGQQCVDVDTSSAVQGDWECRCVGSAGTSTHGPAVCGMCFLIHLLQ